MTLYVVEVLFGTFKNQQVLGHAIYNYIYIYSLGIKLKGSKPEDVTFRSY